MGKKLNYDYIKKYRSSNTQKGKKLSWHSLNAMRKIIQGTIPLTIFGIIILDSKNPMQLNQQTKDILGYALMTLCTLTSIEHIYAGITEWYT